MRLTGWRYAAFVGGLVGLIGVHCYFTMITPMLNPDQYKIYRQELERKFPEKRL